MIGNDLGPVVQRLSGRTILVTGAGGFLGSCVVRQLSRFPCRIRRLLREARHDSVLPYAGLAQIEDVVGDVRVFETWRSITRDVDVIIHLAGQTSAYVAASDPDADLTANVRPVLHMMQACRAAQKCPAVIYAGTATQVGMTTGCEPVNESEPDNPITIYDLHKWMAEQYLEAHTRERVVDATTLRLANVYGPGPLRSGSDRGFLNAMVRRALSGEVLTLYGTGAFVRDYLYVEDAAQAFLVAAASIEAMKGRHFLVGSGTGTTVAAALQCVSERVAAKSGRVVEIRRVEPPPNLFKIEQRHFIADTQRVRRVSGWSPTVDLEEGIDRTIEAMSSRQGVP